MQDRYEDRAKKLITVLGNVIQEYRNKQRKSVYSISAEVCMSKSTWREAELGVCKDIKLTTLWKIAEGLDIPASEILNQVRIELGQDFSLADLK